ncbi:MAG: YlbF family regulator [Pseudolactococcus laudensis]
MNIYDTMNQLEREFRALPEYQAVVAALTAVKSDETASTLYAKFIDIQTKMQMGQLIEPEQQNEAQALFAELQANLIMAELLNTEQALQTITSDLQDIVFKPLQELYGQ